MSIMLIVALFNTGFISKKPLEDIFILYPALHLKLQYWDFDLIIKIIVWVLEVVDLKILAKPLKRFR